MNFIAAFQCCFSVLLFGIAFRYGFSVYISVWLFGPVFRSCFSVLYFATYILSHIIFISPLSSVTAFYLPKVAKMVHKQLPMDISQGPGNNRNIRHSLPNLSTVVPGVNFLPLSRPPQIKHLLLLYLNRLSPV